MSTAPPGLTAYLKQIPLFSDLADEECIDIMRTFSRLAEVRQSLEGGAWPTDTKGLLDLVGFTGKLEGPKSL